MTSLAIAATATSTARRSAFSASSSCSRSRSCSGIVAVPSLRLLDAEDRYSAPDIFPRGCDKEAFGCRPAAASARVSRSAVVEFGLLPTTGRFLPQPVEVTPNGGGANK